MVIHIEIFEWEKKKKKVTASLVLQNDTKATPFFFEEIKIFSIFPKELNIFERDDSSCSIFLYFHLTFKTLSSVESSSFSVSTISKKKQTIFSFLFFLFPFFFVFLKKKSYNWNKNHFHLF